MAEVTNWQPISTAPEGVEVLTRILDKDGERNVQTLRRSGRLFFVPSGDMYVYYTPTHWAHVEAGYVPAERVRAWDQQAIVTALLASPELRMSTMLAMPDKSMAVEERRQREAAETRARGAETHLAKIAQLAEATGKLALANVSQHHPCGPELRNNAGYLLAAVAAWRSQQNSSPSVGSIGDDEQSNRHAEVREVGKDRDATTTTDGAGDLLAINDEPVEKWREPNRWCQVCSWWSSGNDECPHHGGYSVGRPQCSAGCSLPYNHDGPHKTGSDEVTGDGGAEKATHTCGGLALSFDCLGCFPAPTHVEAREIAQRYIDCAFRNEGRERPRHSIPVRMDHDDDVRLTRYIDRQEQCERERDAAESRAEELRKQNIDQGEQITRLYLQWANAERPYRQRAHAQRTELNRLNRTLTALRAESAALETKLAEQDLVNQRTRAEFMRFAQSVGTPEVSVLATRDAPAEAAAWVPAVGARVVVTGRADSDSPSPGSRVEETITVLIASKYNGRSSEP